MRSEVGSVQQDPADKITAHTAVPSIPRSSSVPDLGAHVGATAATELLPVLIEL